MQGNVGTGGLTRIFQLNSKKRAMLIDLLWESLDEARIREIETKWASESEGESTPSSEVNSPLTTDLPPSRNFVHL